MAERTTQSWTQVPHFFLVRELDAGALLQAREQLGPAIERERGVKLTHTDLLVALTARVLTKHPKMNASWTGNAIRLNPHVNISVAMAVTDGVVGAVIPKADRATLADIALQRRDLTERARSGRLRPADLVGGTFTITNLGMYNIDAFSAIIVAAAGRHPGRRPHRRSRGGGEWPARRPSDDDAHAVERSSRGRWRSGGRLSERSGRSDPRARGLSDRLDRARGRAALKRERGRADARRAIITVIYAHPYPAALARRPRAARRRARSARTSTSARSTTSTRISTSTSRPSRRRSRARRLVVWLHPLYWYSVPALLKHWFDKVLRARLGLRRGRHARLRGKHCLWVPTTGGDGATIAPAGIARAPVRGLRAARSSRRRASAACAGSRLVVHGAHRLDDDALRRHRAALPRAARARGVERGRRDERVAH